jgi:8-oxo-dGTP diphosphatase
MQDVTDTRTGPLFGLPQPGIAYVDRPAVYGIAAREDGRIACVRIISPNRVSWDLPGGMIDPGEEPEAALQREFLEETGWAVRPGRLITRARQYTCTSRGEHRFNQALFLACTLVEDREAATEHDHELAWVEPLAALERLRHEAAAWAVTAWLRQRPSD